MIDLPEVNLAILLALVAWRLVDRFVSSRNKAAKALEGRVAALEDAFERKIKTCTDCLDIVTGKASGSAADAAMTITGRHEMRLNERMDKIEGEYETYERRLSEMAGNVDTILRILQPTGGAPAGGHSA